MISAAAMPGPIAVAWAELQAADRPFQKLHRLVDVYETVLKYAAVLGIQNFYSARLAHDFPDVDGLVRERIARPSLGDWASFLRETVRCFAVHQDKLLSPELYGFHFRTSGTKLAFQPHFADYGAAGRLLALRNRLAHGATLPDEESRALLAQHEPDLQTLLTAASFLANLPLLFVEHPDGDDQLRIRSLMGTDYRDAVPESVAAPAALGAAVPPAGHVVVANPAAGTYLDLHPLLLYVECEEEIPTWDERQERLVGKAICRQRKVLFFNDLKSEDRLAALDYWRGHHSRFKAPHPLPGELRARFPKPERPSERANWFTDFVSEWTAHFVGRERELGRDGGPGQPWEPGAIDRFATDSPKRVLALIGAPGLGKSALLARWADTHRAIRHFIREGDAATYDPVRVFENLGRQVSERFVVPWQPPAQPEPAAYRRAFDEMLAAATAKGQVVLVVDGLDEAARSEARGRGMAASRTIVDWLPDPGLLPKGVRLIISTRPELLEHDAFAAKYDQDKAEHLVLDRLSDADVRALLYQVRSKYEVLDAPEYVEAVVERSEGNPLYLRMLLDDLAEGWISFGQIDQLPLGLVDYFDRILDFIEGEGRTRDLPDAEALLAAKQETLETLVAEGIITQEQFDDRLDRERAALEGQAGLRSVEVLALYCLAREPLALADATAILGTDPGEVQRAFEIIRTVLVDDGDGRFAVFHTALREYLLKLDAYTETRLHHHADTFARARERLLAWCARWPEHKARYALRHYPDHLYEAARWADLYALARDEAFLQVQSLTVTGDPQAPLRTLQAALRGAMVKDDAPQMAEFMLAHARRVVETTRESPLAALRAGSLERAWALADLSEIERCVLWHLLLAWELNDTERADEAVQTMARLAERQFPRLTGVDEMYAGELLSRVVSVHDATFQRFAKRLLPDEEALAQIAASQARSSQFAAAVQTAQTISYGSRRAEVLSTISRCQVQVGAFGAAIETARAIQDTDRLVAVLVEIAIAQTQDGDMKAAGDTVATALRIVQDSTRQATGLSLIATAQIRLGQVDAALEAARTIQKLSGSTDKALAAIAVALARAGERAAANDVADGIQSRDDQAIALSEIAVIETRSGELGAAVKIAERIQDPDGRAKALYKVALVQAEIGPNRAAHSAILAALRADHAIRNEFSPVKKDAQIAVALFKAAAGDMATARTMLTAEVEGTRDAVRLARIAIAQATIGDTDAARATFAAARERARKARRGEDAAALRLVAEEQVAAGRLEDARATFSAAVEAAHDIEQDYGDYSYQATGFIEIAASQTQAGLAHDARSTFSAAFEIREDYWKTEALRKIAVAQATTGDIVAAHSTFAAAFRGARAIRDIVWKWAAASNIAAGQAECGAYAAAQETIGLIEDGWRQVAARRELVATQAQAGKFAAAIQIANAIQDGHERTAALVQVAGAQAAADQLAAARTTFAAAVTTACRIQDKYRRSEALGEVALAQAKVGEFSAALEAARTIRDAERRSDTLAKIAMAQAEADDIAAARTTLAAALKSAKSVRRGGEQAYAMCRLVKAFAATGEFSVALDIASNIAGSTYLAMALRDIGVSQAATGDARAARATLAAALEAARGEGSYEWRVDMLCELAVAQAQAGETQAPRTTLAHALEVADGTNSWSELARKIKDAQHQVVEIYVQAEDFVTAIDTAHTIREDWDQADALGKVASAQTQAGQFMDAVKTAREIRRDYSRAEALRSIAVAQAESGSPAAALETVRAISDDSSHSRALEQISVALARAGRFADSVELARAIRDEFWRDKALSQVVKLAAQANHVATARDVAHAIGTDYRLASALRDIAAAELRTGHPEAARSTGVHARMVSAWIRDSGEQADALCAIAAAEAQAGELVEAVETAQWIRNDSEKVGMLCQIAMTQAEAGEVVAAQATFSAALEAARSISSDFSQDAALGKIARTQAEAGDWAGAINTALTTQSEQCRSEALGTIAAIQARAGAGQRALRTADLIVTRRDNLLPAIAIALVEVGDFSSFKSLVVQCSFSAQAACEVARMLPVVYPAWADGIKATAAQRHEELPSLEIRTGRTARQRLVTWVRDRLRWRRSRS